MQRKLTFIETWEKGADPYERERGNIHTFPDSSSISCEQPLTIIIHSVTYFWKWSLSYTPCLSTGSHANLQNVRAVPLVPRWEEESL